jgi:AGZA family xanthine/uracil permease-like MFS transporter
VTSYVESSAGVAAGGWSGVTAITTGLLFLLALLLAPFLGIVPSSATAPALIVVGSLMVSAVSEIAWSDPLIAVPAFLTIIMIPLTHGIVNGLVMRVLFYAALRNSFRPIPSQGLAALHPGGAVLGAILYMSSL